MKSKNTFVGIVVLGIGLLIYFGAYRIYTFLNPADATTIIEIDEEEMVQESKMAYTEEELFIQRLSNPRAGDIYLIKCYINHRLRRWSC